MLVYKCDRCESIMPIRNKVYEVKVTKAIVTFGNYDLCEECFDKLSAWFEKKEPTERDCEHCVHHSYLGCESWECQFKRRTDGDSN